MQRPATALHGRGCGAATSTSGCCAAAPPAPLPRAPGARHERQQQHSHQQQQDTQPRRPRPSAACAAWFNRGGGGPAGGLPPPGPPPPAAGGYGGAPVQTDAELERLRQQAAYSSAPPRASPGGPPPPPPGPTPPPGGGGGGDGLSGYAKALVAAAFVTGLGAGVYFDAEINVSPNQVASTEIIDRRTPNSEVRREKTARAGALDGLRVLFGQRLRRAARLGARHGPARRGRPQRVRPRCHRSARSLVAAGSAPGRPPAPSSCAAHRLRPASQLPPPPLPSPLALTIFDRRQVCMAYGYSAMVFDQRVFVTYNPFNLYVTQVTLG